MQKRDDIAIEKSADQMDEIQYASERDLAIRNVDRESTLLRDVKAALRRIHDGSFGVCIECESAISSNASQPCHGRRVASSARPPPIRMGGKNAIVQWECRRMPREGTVLRLVVARHRR